MMEDIEVTGQFESRISPAFLLSCHLFWCNTCEFMLLPIDLICLQTWWW